MGNRRAPKPVVSGAMARNLMERDGCAWCGSSSDVSTATLEYKVPPRNDEEDHNLDNLVAICSICSQTEVRRIRFPKGALLAAAKVEGMSFSEIVRISLAGWLRSRNPKAPPEDPYRDAELAFSEAAELWSMNYTEDFNDEYPEYPRQSRSQENLEEFEKVTASLKQFMNSYRETSYGIDKKMRELESYRETLDEIDKKMREM